VEPELEQRDRRASLGGKPHRDHVGVLEAIELPLDLLAKPGLVDRLPPAGVPGIAPRVQHDDGPGVLDQPGGQSDGQGGLPVDRVAHLDRAGQEHHRRVGSSGPRRGRLVHQHAVRMPRSLFAAAVFATMAR